LLNRAVTVSLDGPSRCNSAVDADPGTVTTARTKKVTPSTTPATTQSAVAPAVLLQQARTPPYLSALCYRRRTSSTEFTCYTNTLTSCNRIPRSQRHRKWRSLCCTSLRGLRHPPPPRPSSLSRAKTQCPRTMDRARCASRSGIPSRRCICPCPQRTRS
jgi:hypothetical protein